MRITIASCVAVFLGVVAVTSATMFAGPALVFAGTASAQSRVQSGSHVVRLGIVVSKDKPQMQVMVKDGEMGVLQVDGGGRFGFTPTVSPAQSKTVTVEIFDAAGKEPKSLGKVDLQVGAEIVDTKTTPSFGLRVSEVR